MQSSLLLEWHIRFKNATCCPCRTWPHFVDPGTEVVCCECSHVLREHSVPQVLWVLKQSLFSDSPFQKYTLSVLSPPLFDSPILGTLHVPPFSHPPRAYCPTLLGWELLLLPSRLNAQLACHLPFRMGICAWSHTNSLSW